jgi:hypothetical protein
VNRKQKWVVVLWCPITALSGLWAGYDPFDGHHRLSEDFYQAIILWVVSTAIASAIWWMFADKNMGGKN